LIVISLPVVATVELHGFAGVPAVAFPKMDIGPIAIGVLEEAEPLSHHQLYPESWY